MDMGMQGASGATRCVFVCHWARRQREMQISDGQSVVALRTEWTLGPVFNAAAIEKVILGRGTSIGQPKGGSCAVRTRIG